MPLWITILNTLAAAASTGFGVAAVLRPAILAPSREMRSTSRFYPAMYAARAIPLGVAVGIAVWVPSTSVFLLLLLGVAAVAQIVDAVTGLAYRLWGMVAGAAFAIVCHCAAIMALLGNGPT